MEESHFKDLTETTLIALSDAIENADHQSVIDCELTEGVLTITIENITPHKVYVINRHVPMRQIWLSSPISGGLHFDYEEKTKRWIATTGEDLHTLLSEEFSSFIPIPLTH